MFGQKAMGSILGGSSRDFNRASRSTARTTTPLSPRATYYALDQLTSLRSISEPSSDSLNDRNIRILRPKRTVWCSSAASGRLAAQSEGTGRSRSTAKVTAVATSTELLWGVFPAPGRRHSQRVGRSKVMPLPAISASASFAAEANMEVPYTLSNGMVVHVRKIRVLDELRQVATLRADAYYAENQSRFVGSLKKKFVEQEVESLQQRTSIMSRQGKPYSECLVAADASSGAVLACIDMRLPAALNGTHPHGVPQDDPTGCYLLNVVVREDVRGQGLGQGIMQVAMMRAVQVWGARRLYTHVEADNEVAFRVYHSCGFQQHSTDSKYEAATKLGQTVLLWAPAEAAPLTF
ncbi:hypothetical protein VaNZ11_009727 [Volvox africanus]|uniref:N-acetyltransferase domain-containing protein n=1 Tax=Volvox africanus TaxID=51714 RepID=A0ABQ5S9K7_9CHLO|nr:hypothetical protein VaNZ11_009727 [Volvox africanus]